MDIHANKYETQRINLISCGSISVKTEVRKLTREHNSLGWHVCRTKLARSIRNQKGLTKPKIARTAPKNFLNNSRGRPGHCPVKQGFEANRTRKFTRTFGKVFVTQFLCGTFQSPSIVLSRHIFSQKELRYFPRNF